MVASKDLADILAARNKDGKYDAIIERARLNGYHDFKFDRIPEHPEWAEDVCPKVRLVSDLSTYPELEDIRQDVISGMYDDKMDAEDKQTMRISMLEDHMPDAMFKQLGLEPPTPQEHIQYGL